MIRRVRNRLSVALVASLVVVVPAARALAAGPHSTLVTDEVTSALDDGGSGTLRSVIAAAAPGATVTFAPALAGATIDIAQGAIPIANALTIDGPGAGQLTIDAGGLSQIFTITGGDVAVSGITFTHGFAGTNAARGEGGAIRYRTSGGHTLTLTADAFVDNTANGAVPGGRGENSGGAVSLPAPADSSGFPQIGSDSLVITNSTFTGNASGDSNGADAGARGGALDFWSSSGTLTISGSEFSGNQAGGDGNGTVDQSGQGIGGAVAAETIGGGSATITDSRFSDNRAGGNGGAQDQSARGFGGGLYVQTPELDISGSTFDANHVGGDAGGGFVSGYGFGAGLNAEGAAATVITDSTFVGNSAGSGGAFGGGIVVAAFYPVTLVHVTITGNSVESGSYGSGVAADPPFGANQITAAAVIVSGNTGGNNCDWGPSVQSVDSLEGPAGSTTCHFDLTSADPQLDPLHDNGGPTPTQAPAKTSPVVGAVPNGATSGSVTLCPTTDQRGIASDAGQPCDVGAVQIVRQPITFGALPSSPHIGESFEVSATGGPNPVTFSIDPSTTNAACSLAGDGTTVSFGHAGSCVIDAATAGDATHHDGTASATIVVPKNAQTIQFTHAAPDFGVTGGTYDASATTISGLPVAVTIDAASAAVCTVDSGTHVVSFATVGTCTIHADQSGNNDWEDAHAIRDITVDESPVFTAAAPPLETTYHAGYSYDFDASGTPAPTYRLAPGAPGFLHIDATTGHVSGTVPARVVFVYSVIATNTDTASGLEVGSATAGPFRVSIGWPTVTYGKPTVKKTAPLGFYLNQTGNQWRLVSTHPRTGKVTFSGTVTVNTGDITRVRPIQLEATDTVVTDGSTATFAFRNFGGIDGFTFVVPGPSTRIVFTLKINGQPATTAQILLGQSATPSTSDGSVMFIR